MGSVKAFKVRLYPNQAQETELRKQLGLLCDFYNACLEERLNWWDKNKPARRGKKEDRLQPLVYVSKYSQQRQIKTIRNELPEYKTVFQRAMENVCSRVDLAYKAFFRLDGAGKPRFRAKKFYDSITYNRNGFVLETKPNCEQKYLRLCYGRGIKDSAPMMLRNWEQIPDDAKIKQVVVKQENKNEWYAVIQCEVNTSALPATGNKPICGIDVGLMNFVKDSQDNTYGDIAWLQEMEMHHRKLMKKRDHHKRFSHRWKRANKQAAQYATKIARAKKLRLDEISRVLVDSFSMVGVEALDIAGMKKREPGDRRTSMRRNIALAAWGKLIQMLTYKGGEVGCEVIPVPARGTSSTCCQCGASFPRGLHIRRYTCSCGLEVDRDLNGAINVLKRAVQKRMTRQHTVANAT
jgi:putative transposase